MRAVRAGPTLLERGPHAPRRAAMSQRKVPSMTRSIHQCAVLAGFGLLLAVAPARADGLRCNDRLVSTGDSIYVVDAFQKKSKTGVSTPKADIDRIRTRLKQLRELIEK